MTEVPPPHSLPILSSQSCDLRSLWGCSNITKDRAKFQWSELRKTLLGFLGVCSRVRTQEASLSALESASQLWSQIDSGRVLECFMHLWEHSHPAVLRT